MKYVLAAICCVILSFNVSAQFTSAKLQASGLTCAMCSKAINNAVAELGFVESVKSDIKNSTFNITFKKDVPVDIDALGKAVKDAGFSVASLKATGNFDNVKVDRDAHVLIGTQVYHFVAANQSVLNGARELTFIDKDFVLPKQFKKYTSTEHMPCLQTGKMATCCQKIPGQQSDRIFHVTI
jgi:copper chaperone CopZ